MTTKYITTYIAAGYTLSPVYNTLSITSTGGVGGTGIYASKKATIINDGRIVAAHDGVAIDLRRGGEVINGGATDNSAYIFGQVGWGHSVNVENYGTINGYVTVRDSLTNGSAADHGAVITGTVKFGVAKKLINPTKITITNFGSITGVIEGLAGVVVNGTSADTGANIYGTVLLDSGIQGARLAPGTFSNFGTVTSSTHSEFRGGAILGYEDTLLNGSSSDSVAFVYGIRYGVVLFPEASIVNFGTVRGGYQCGVFSTGGNITNGGGSQSNALISGPVAVSELSSENDLQVLNYGTIAGGNSINGVGVYFIGISGLVNGSLTNHSALIEGYSGVVARAGSTITNFGTIKGGSGAALDFQYFTDTLVLEAGSRFVGAVIGGGGTLDFDTGTGNLVGLPGDGAITASGGKSPATAFNAFGTLEIGPTASFSLSGGGSINAGQGVINKGFLTLSGAVTNNGIIAADGGALIVEGAVAGNGLATINGGTLDFASTFAENVKFTGRKGELELGQSQNYIGTMTGFSLTGQTSLDLDDIGFVNANEATYADGVLTVTDGVHTANIHLAGVGNGQVFVASSDQHGGVKIVAQADVQATSLQFIAAMARLGAAPGVAVRPSGAYASHMTMLVGPRPAIA